MSFPRWWHQLKGEIRYEASDPRLSSDPGMLVRVPPEIDGVAQRARTPVWFGAVVEGLMKMNSLHRIGSNKIDPLALRFAAHTLGGILKRLVTLAVAAILALSACGSESMESPSTPTPTPVPTVEATATPAQFASIIAEHERNWRDYEDNMTDCAMARR